MTAMTFTRNVLSWLSRWPWPFLWILLIPLVTVPWHAQLLDLKHACVARDPDNVFVTYDCSRNHMIMTLLPGLLNFVAFIWVAVPRQPTRYAALVAGSLGAIRFLIPLHIYLSYGDTVPVGDLTISPGNSLPASLAFWGVSLAATIVFGIVLLRVRTTRYNHPNQTTNP